MKKSNQSMETGAFRKGIAWILLLVMMGGCVLAFGETAAAGPYEKAAAGVVRDWKLLDMISFACETSGTAEGMFPEYGVYMDTEQGSLIAYTGGNILLLLYGGTDESWMQAMFSLAAYGVDMRIISLGITPGLCTEEEIRSDYLYAMGAALTAGLHRDAALPVFIKNAEGEWTPCPEQTRDEALALYARLGGDCPCEACVPAGEGENALELAVMDLAAYDYIRSRMIDYIPYTGDEYASLQPGAYVFDTPGDLALIIRTEDTAHAFWFLNDAGMEAVLGYTAGTFHTAGIPFDGYDLIWVRVDEDGNKEGARMTPEEKEDAMNAFMIMNVWEAGQMPADGK